jgi:hypothetical protein
MILTREQLAQQFTLGLSEAEYQQLEVMEQIAETVTRAVRVQVADLAKTVPSGFIKLKADYILSRIGQNLQEQS